MTDLKPRTRYHCPVSVAGDGYGHSSLYTGDYSSPADAPTDNQGDTPMISPTPEHDKALSFHPLTPGRGEVHELLRSAAKVLAAVYDNHLPPSREASLAFTAVQESLMWANAAVAIHTPPPGISGTDD